MALLAPLLAVFGLLPCAFAASGTASFTSYTGCGSNGKEIAIVTIITCNSHRISQITVACGITGGGLHTAALNQLNFGAGPGQGAGPGCGRCFQLTGTADPFSPNYQGPFNSIKVKVNIHSLTGLLWRLSDHPSFR